MTTTGNQPDYTQLPSITALLDAARHDERFGSFSTKQITDACRRAVDVGRKAIADGRADDIENPVEHYLISAHGYLFYESLKAIRPVINATGIVLHTGLGRSVLAAKVAERVRDAAANYGNVELNLDNGLRGRRGEYSELLLRKLTGAEDALIVNNNAAATMLVLAALAHDQEVIVSRGQLIEIGGSYRLPDVMEAGGAKLREVGTTNKTRLADYERALNENSAMIMRVHTSNYRIVGFTESPDMDELAALAAHHQLVSFDDIGSGALFDDPLWTRLDEPHVEASLRAGADVVAFSGDKLLGGPQAGILLGKRAIIEKLRAHPMARALRVCKLTLAALEATLEIYLDADRSATEIPTIARLNDSPAEMRARAQELANWLRLSHPLDDITIADDESFAGGGSLPAQPLPTIVVRWRPQQPVDRVARQLRTQSPSVLTRIHDGALVFDFRSISADQVKTICSAIAKIE